MAPPRQTANVASLESRDSDNDDSSDDGASVHSEARDKQKRRAEQAKEKKKLIGNTRIVLDAILHNPGLWRHRDTQHIRKFVSQVQSDPATFPPYSHSNEEHGESGQADANGNYTVGVATTLRDHAEFAPDVKPIVLVSHAGLKSIVNEHHGITREAFVVTLHVVDGDSNFILVKLSYTISDRLRHSIEPGSVLQLTHFIPIYFDHGPPPEASSNLEAALLVLGCNVLRRDALPEAKLQARPADRVLLVDSATPSAVLGTTASDTSDESNLETQSGDWQPQQCDGSICSIYGLRFDSCITQCIPLSSIVLHEAARENPFVTKEVEYMTMSNKRFLLYYWYSTNVYGICGKGNRIHLPTCLEDAIFEAHHFHGEKRTGFKPAPHDDNDDPDPEDTHNRSVRRRLD